MAAPPAYTRTYSFSTYETANPGQPKPGSSLDTEYDNVANAMSGTQIALALIQRDDGQLANNSVGPDQLQDDLFDAIADGITDEAEMYAGQAANSAAAASVSANSAAASSTGAATSAATASGAAGQAGVSQGIAQGAADAAALSAAEAADSAVTAGTYANETAGSVAACEAHVQRAEEWAELLPDAVDDGLYSAKFWALKAEENNSTTDIDLGTAGADIGEAFAEWDAIDGNELPPGQIYATWGDPPLTYVLTGDDPSDATDWTMISGGIGPAGPANVLTIGTVTTGDAGSPAEATITGTSPAQVLNLTIPQGLPGADGSGGGSGGGGLAGSPIMLHSTTVGTPVGGWNTGYTMYIKLRGRQILTAASKMKLSYTVASGTVHFDYFKARRTLVGSDTFIDSVPITFAGDASPSLSAGEHISEEFTIPVDLDHDVWIVAYINPTTLVGATLPVGNDSAGGVYVGYRDADHGNDTTAGAAGITTLGNGNAYGTPRVFTTTAGGGGGSGGGGSVANPTATIGLTVINGVSTDAMRADAAPPLDQAIVPTWTGLHTFAGSLDVRLAGTSQFKIDSTGAWLVTGSEGVSGQALHSQGPGLPPVWRTSAGGSIELGYNFSNAVGTANPGSQKMSLNSAVYSAVTVAVFNSLAMTNFDANTIISLLAAGHRIYIQQRNDSSKAVVYQVTGPATQFTGYWTVPVSMVDSRGTMFPNNADLNCVFILSVSASASANPSASVGLSVVNGVATTFMRSDAAPPLSQAIVPTWTGIHTFSAGATPIVLKAGAADSVYLPFYADTAAPSARSGYLGWGTAGSDHMVLVNEQGNGNIQIDCAGTGWIEPLCDLRGRGIIRATGWYGVPVASSLQMATEIGVSGGVGQVVAYNRSGAAYGSLNVGGSQIDLALSGGSPALRVTGANQVQLADGIYNMGATLSLRFNTSAALDTYATVYIAGAVGGFAGIGIDDAQTPKFMSSGTLFGVHVSTGAYWSWQDNGTTFTIGKACSAPSYTTAGTITATGAVTGASFNATSSRAIKRETGRPQRACDVLARLRPIFYRLLEHQTDEQLGLIAEEVHAVCPQLSNGKTVAYDRLALLLLADWQERYA